MAEIENLTQLEELHKLIGDRNFAESKSLLKSGGRLFIFTKLDYGSQECLDWRSHIDRFLKQRFESGSEYAGFVLLPDDCYYEENVHLTNRKHYTFDLNFLKL